MSLRQVTAAMGCTATAAGLGAKSIQAPAQPGENESTRHTKATLRSNVSSTHAENEPLRHSGVQVIVSANGTSERQQSWMPWGNGALSRQR